MAFNCGTDTCGFNRKTKLRGKRDDFLFEAKQQLQRDVKKVSAAARWIKHRYGGKQFLKFGETLPLGGVAFAFGVGGASSLLMFAHSRRNGCINTGSTSVLMSASLV